MQNKIIQAQFIVDGITKKKDGTLSMKLGSAVELSNDEMAILFGFGNKELWVAFSETAHTLEDLNIPESLTEFRTDKTPSQRLRSVLYVYWEKEIKNKTKETFDAYYKRKIDTMIESIKEKLD